MKDARLEILESWENLTDQYYTRETTGADYIEEERERLNREFKNAKKSLLKCPVRQELVDGWQVQIDVTTIEVDYKSKGTNKSPYQLQTMCDYCRFMVPVPS